MTKTAKDSPKEIWLEPDCDGEEYCGNGENGRSWCQDNVWDDCEECGSEPVKYIRADLVKVSE